MYFIIQAIKAGVGTIWKLHQRVMLKRNGCRESCSRVNWSISARLKPVDLLAADIIVGGGKF